MTDLDAEVSRRLRQMSSSDLYHLWSLALERERLEEEARIRGMLRGETWAELEARVAANVDPETVAVFDQITRGSAPNHLNLPEPIDWPAFWAGCKARDEAKCDNCTIEPADECPDCPYQRERRVVRHVVLPS